MPRGTMNRRPVRDTEPQDELQALDQATLQKDLMTLRTKHLDLKSKRNYTEMERDMIEQFYKNTITEKDEFANKIILRERDMQQMEDNHRTEVKVYLQKVKYLTVKREKNLDDMKKEGTDKRTNEVQEWKQKNKRMQQEKRHLKKEFDRIEKVNEKEIKAKNEQNEIILRVAKESFAKRLQELTDRYEQDLKILRDELELKLKVDIHEIEERKNQHINDLMRNHDLAFAGLKEFYNDITAENLNLIKTQKEEIARIQNRRFANSKTIAKLKEQNNDLQKPLEKARKEKDELDDILKQFGKDKRSLQNLKIKLVSLKERYSVLIKEKRD